MHSIATTFALRDGVLCAIDATGKTVQSHEATGTRIVQLLPLPAGVVVREDCYRFPRDRSNLYCLDSGLRLLWSAERPSQADANPVAERNGALICASRTIDPGTGRIIRREFVK